MPGRGRVAERMRCNGARLHGLRLGVSRVASLGLLLAWAARAEPALLLDAQARGANAKAVATGDSLSDSPAAAPTPAADDNLEPVMVASEANPEAPVETREGWPFLVGVGALSGVLRPHALALLMSAQIPLGVVRTNLTALMSGGSLEFGPGTIQTTLLGGELELCVVPHERERWRVDLCSGPLLANVSAKPRGFTTNTERAAPYLALSFGSVLAWRVRRVHFEVGAQALWGLPAQQFQVDGLGVAYAAPAVGVLSFVRFGVPIGAR